MIFAYMADCNKLTPITTHNHKKFSYDEEFKINSISNFLKYAI